MNRRTLIKHVFGFAALMALPLAALAATPLAQGKNFQQIHPAQPSESAGKIEVIEFFSYACPHCFEFEGKISAWSKTLPKDVVFKRVPISFNRESWATMGKVYLSLEAMGLTDRLNILVFSALHNERINLTDETIRNGWLKKNGVDVARFNDTFRSFSTASHMQRATQLAATYKIDGVPTMVIGGKFQTSPAMNDSFESTLSVADQLIAKARATRGR